MLTESLAGLAGDTPSYSFSPAMTSKQLGAGMALSALALMLIMLTGCTPAPSPTSIPATALLAPTPSSEIRVEPGHILTPTPLPTPVIATATPVQTKNIEPVFSQLTTGGCCVQPFFSPDATRVLYLDKPSPGATTGLWSVPVSQPLAPPELFSTRVGPFSADMAYNVFLQNGRTTVERTKDAKQWVIDNGGRRVMFSPDEASISWMVSEDAGNFDIRRSDIWLAGIDGSAPRQVATLYGGGIQAWLSDSNHMLVSGKAKRDDVTSTLSLLSLTDGSQRKLIDAERPRSIALSPGDRYIAYYISQARDEKQDGMFILDLTLTSPQPQRIDFFGAYHWCSPTKLYYIPLKLAASANELWRYDVTTGQSTQVITADALSPFKVGNGDWDVSANGRQIVYLNGRDHNIWLVTLPDAC
ncbi:MAG TPA: hypothetical protein VGK87_00460 [Anaerolineae bacterium]